MSTTFKVEGLREAQKALRGMGGTQADAKALNRDIVDSVVVPEARNLVPVRSGKLRGSISSDATPTYGYILAGKRGDVAYAGVIHFGWSTRGLGSRASRSALLAAGSAAGAGGALGRRSLSKASRASSGRGGRGKVRGGPIAPQPFIYDAIDARVGEVFKAYEDQLEHRAKIEGLL